MHKIGLDVGSTTAKIVVLNSQNELIYSSYKRHQANVRGVLAEFIEDLRGVLGSSEPFHHSLFLLYWHFMPNYYLRSHLLPCPVAGVFASFPINTSPVLYIGISCQAIPHIHRHSWRWIG